MSDLQQQERSAAMSILKPTQPPRPDYAGRYTSPGYTVRQDGQCDRGTIIRAYLPTEPYRDDASRLKVVVYLHGFCLGAAEIYQSHLAHLARQGYYVFFPTYQHGFCSYQDSLPTTVGDLLRSLFRPFPISPQGWLRGAAASVAGAYARAGLAGADVDTYLFGHSLGGLFAMSWPALARGLVPDALMPRQVVVANPIPDSESLIPAPNRVMGRMLGAFRDRVDIADTGGALRVPVAILHGSGDTLVPARAAWAGPFGAIASAQKRFYCSQSDDHGTPALVADHAQATVDTGFLPEPMVKMSVGGVGSENTLDWRYIWSGLDQVIRDHVCADKLSFDMGAWSDGVPVKSIRSGTPQEC
jgi:hypothetical protein